LGIERRNSHRDFPVIAMGSPSEYNTYELGNKKGSFLWLFRLLPITKEAKIEKTQVINRQMR